MTNRRRALSVMIIVACTLALPILIVYGNSLDAERRVAAMYLNALNGQEMQLETMARREQEYERFREEAESFLAFAGERGVESGRWVRHEVNVQRLDLGFGDLRTLLTEMDGGERAWFAPALLEVNVASRGARDGVINHQGREVPPSQVDPMYRERVVVNLKGEFLVYQQ